MAVSAQEYQTLLKQLLPPGLAFPRGDSTSMFAMLIEVWALELARADARTQALIVEADPRYAVESFQEWLDEWGLPDECMKLWGNTNLSTLRSLLLWKMTDLGNLNPRFFIDLARKFGYQIVIDEFNRHSVVSRVTDVLAYEKWAFKWRVNVFSSQGGHMTYHDVAGDAKEPLAWWGDSLIECLIRRYAPPQAELLFGYIEEGANNGQDLGR